ncbi:hypothetical protein WR25_20016 [Diploscapter pachys]|uniref:Uncharacterized protein n=1 Tax=Diploscapter pachys TaxID=2018661 RepID=A0A2A2JTZ5_9BILA|nr:hypothetical protein WR25_20016 [Diploscapter pachys]
MQPCPGFDNWDEEPEAAAVRQRLRETRIRSLASNEQAVANRSREERRPIHPVAPPKSAESLDFLRSSSSISSDNDDSLNDNFTSSSDSSFSSSASSSLASSPSFSSPESDMILESWESSSIESSSRWSNYSSLSEFEDPDVDPMAGPAVLNALRSGFEPRPPPSSDYIERVREQIKTSLFLTAISYLRPMRIMSEEEFAKLSFPCEVVDDEKESKQAQEDQNPKQQPEQDKNEKHKHSE